MRLRLPAYVTAGALVAVFGLSGAVLARSGDVLPDGPGKDVVVRVCTGCHEASPITRKRRNSEDWDYVISKMIDGGAELTSQEQDVVHAYLVANLGLPVVPGPAPVSAAEKPPSGR